MFLTNFSEKSKSKHVSKNIVPMNFDKFELQYGYLMRNSVLHFQVKITRTLNFILQKKYKINKIRIYQMSINNPLFIKIL